MKPLIVPIFISHSGCPHRCVFCDQEQITGRSRNQVGADQVREILHKALGSKRFNEDQKAEVAFYGGTFTGLPEDRIKELLSAAAPFVESGRFTSIRVSTRPDFIYGEVLAMMKARHVKTVELGAQSLDDGVLQKARRGHTAGDVIRAVGMLKQTGFRVGIQLMPGLPGDSEKIFLRTIERVIDLEPDMVRLYPALVIRGTGLARMYTDGAYSPLTLREAVKLCARAVTRLEDHGIPVIRIGLMPSPSLLRKDSILSGPWHPAFGFLVRSAIHREAIWPFLPPPGAARRIGLYAVEREIPLIRGYKNRGIRAIEQKTGAEVLGVWADNRLAPGSVRVEQR